MRPVLTSCLSLAAAMAAVAPAPVMAQDDMSDVKIEAVPIRDGVAVLFGRGGNIGVSYGSDGTVLVDDQFAPLTERIQGAISSLGAKPVKFLINTHWHFDHAGGNENFGKAGALIFAHQNVRVRLASGGEAAGVHTPPAPVGALPVVTYGEAVTFHLNGDTVEAFYLGGGHTDGDSAIFWHKANVLHTGDMFMNRSGFPFVDVDSGGNVEHLMTSLQRMIARIDDKTVVIPGHGPLASKADLVGFLAMIETAVGKVKALKDGGSTMAQALAAKPIEGVRNAPGFVTDDQFIEAIWKSLDSHGH